MASEAVDPRLTPHLASRIRVIVANPDKNGKNLDAIVSVSKFLPLVIRDPPIITNWLCNGKEVWLD